MPKSASRGRLGENLAAAYLFENGFNIVERNFHSRYGEIDIIAENGELLVFTEVKARNERSLERPAAAVTPSKRRKIIQTAMIFLSEHEYDLQPRFDVCEITLDSRTDMLIKLNYIENAFDAEGFS